MSKTGRPRCPWQGLALPLLLLAGCTVARPPLDRALLKDADAGPDQVQVAANYLVRCPDIIDVTVAEHPELSGPRALAVDGRMDLGDYGRLRIEGRSIPDVARCIAEVVQVPTDQVRVRVADYRSQEVFLFGQVAGVQRAVAYRGPETVLELLQRTGGITPGAAPDDVYVIRGHVADGRRPEVFHVDLRAIVMEHDNRTNVRLQPFDQVYVGQTRTSTLEKCVPPCLQPLYELICGLYRPANAASASP